MPPAMLTERKATAAGGEREGETKEAILLSVCVALGRDGGGAGESLTFV